jgi:hypothetical protein
MHVVVLDHDLHTALAKVALMASAVGPTASSRRIGGEQARPGTHEHCGSGGWPEPQLFLVCVSIPGISPAWR